MLRHVIRHWPVRQRDARQGTPYRDAAAGAPDEEPDSIRLNGEEEAVAGER